MSKLKRILCFVLISAVLVSAVCIPLGIKKSMGETVPSTLWNNNASSTLSTDSSGAYLIKSSADLACFNKNMSTYASKTIKLMVDVDMSTHKWETNQTKFNGVFEGNNKTISGIKYSGSSSHVGLFSTLNYNSKVQNLVLNNFYISQTIGAGATNHVGFLAGYIEGSALNVRNCTVKNSTIEYTANTSNSGSINAGGIGGFTFSSNLQYCYVVNTIIQATSGNKPNAARVGGIVGNANNSNITISCTIGGTISGHGYSYCYAGGIVGINTYANSPSGGTISKCFTEGGSVKSTTYTALANTFASNAGGIAGYLSYGSISNCYSTGAAILAKCDGNDEVSEAISVNIGRFRTRDYANEIGGEEDYQYAQNNGQSYRYIKGTTYKCSGGIVGRALDGTNISFCYSTLNQIGDISDTNKDRIITQYKINVETRDYKQGIWLPWEDDYWTTDFSAREFVLYAQIYTHRTAGGIYGYAPNGYKLNNCYFGETIKDFSGSGQFSYSHSPVTGSDGNPGNFCNETTYYLYCTSSTEITLCAEWNACQDGTPSGFTAKYDIYVDSNGLDKSTNYTISSRQNESLAGSDISKITSATGSAFLTKSGVNGGKPFIKDFYWEYSAVMPAD